MRIVKRERRPSPDPLRFVRAGRNEYINFDDPFLKTGESIYPDPTILLEELSKNLGVGHTNLLLGLGAESLIRDFIIVCKLYRGIKKIVIPNPTYFMYEVLGMAFGLEVVKYNLAISGIMENTFDEIQELDDSIIVVVNPGSPISDDNSNLIARKVKSKNSYVLVDEVYFGFGGKSHISEATTRNDLIVIRSFSKAYGLAGIRVGYGVCCGNLNQEMNSIRLANELPAHSIQMACDALKKGNQYIQQKTQNVIKIREKAEKSLKDMGYKVLVTQGNSVTILVESHEKKSQLKNKFEEKNIYLNANYASPYEKIINFTTTNEIYVEKILNVLRDTN